jgi:hypothetical protein
VCAQDNGENEERKIEGEREKGRGIEIMLYRQMDR